MLQRDPRPCDLARTRRSTQLLRQLVALREPGRAQRMALRQESAGGVGDVTPAVRVVAVGDEFRTASFVAEPERFVTDELVLRKAIVKLDHIDVVGSDAGGLVDFSCRRLCHSVTDELHHVVGGKRVGTIGRHRLRGD